MKIAVITTHPPKDFGGTEVVWNQLTKDEGNKIDFYTIYEDKTKKSISLPKIFSKIPSLFHLSEIVSTPFLWKKIDENKYDLVIYDKILGWSAKKNIKKICYNHGSYSVAGEIFKKKNWFVYLFYTTVLRFLEKKSYSNADRVVSISPYLSNELENKFGIDKKKIFYIPNGVDMRLFRPLSNKNQLRKKWRLPENKFLLLFPSRPSFGKGFDIAHELIKKLPKNCRLVVLAKKDRKIQDKNISWLGKVKHKDMSEVYNLCDIVLFPSRYEGFGLIPIEAGACRKAVVASNVGILNKNKNAPISQFITEDQKDFENKVISIINNKKNLKKWGEAWKNFSKKYDLKEQTRRFKKLLKEIE